MSNRNLDKLFQEKLKDFSEVPDEKVWNAIEASLDKKRKKRIIPLWWKLGGIAAVLALALTIINPLAERVSDTPTTTDTKNTIDDILDQTKEEAPNGNPIQKNKNAIVVDDTKEQEILNTENGEASQKIKTSEKSDTNGLIQPKNRTKIKNSRLEPKDRQLVDKDRSTDENVLKDLADPSLNKKAMVVDKTTKNDSKGDSLKNKAARKSNTMVTSSNNPNTNNAQNQDNKGDLDNTETTEGSDQVPDQTELVAHIKELDPEKKSIYEAIDEQAEEEEVVEEFNSRWSAGASVAPVYFNSIGEGSPIGSIFATNSKSGNTNLSYGLSVAYEINKKLRIRSGVHRVDYGYDTNDVEFSSALLTASSNQLKNIDYAPTSKNLVVTSEVASPSNLDAFSNSIAIDVSGTSNTSRNGRMAQQFGYLEVPLELDYALIDRKFGLNLIGGLSSLFLIDNTIAVNSGELTTEIGEANNLNSLNFSTNVGFGVNYKFTPKIRLNIEPVFKYQLNTFSDVSGEFRPFSIGIYSGLDFKF